MKRKAHVSKSTYRAMLSVQRTRDEKSGLLVTDRYFAPSEEISSHVFLWFIIDCLIVTSLLVGLMLLITSGFSVPVSVWFYPALLFMGVGFSFLFKNKYSRKFWIPVAMIITIGFFVMVFLFQKQLVGGFGQFINLMVDTLNRVYSGDLDAPVQAFGVNYAETFLLFVAFIFTVWIASSIFKANNMLMLYLLLFPVIILMMLCGAAGNVAALFIILFGLVLCLAFSKPRKQYRMWGGDNKELYEKNRRRYESIQKRSTIAILVMCIFMSIPGFLVVRPFLAFSLQPAEEMSVKVQNGFLNKMIKVLPKLSAGKWNLNLDAVGGGVEEGNLSTDDGHLLEGVEDLKLTMSRKPTETLYLKGFVGVNYEAGSWKQGYASTFDGAAINWNTEGQARTYIQNLTFLRMSYALSRSGDSDSSVAESMSAFNYEPASLKVERINANDKYTYVPYGIYLNDYYNVEAGDGAITGQKDNDDIYYFYNREDLNSVFHVWNDLNNTNSILDRTEEAYRNFCKKNYMDVIPGYEKLDEMVKGVIEENKWKPDKNIEDISEWIRQYLNDNYKYELLPGSVPEGRDELEYFIHSSKTGNSVHYASAAVLLYRMAGIPARYVVGYEIPAGLFTIQIDKSYTAVVEGDNSQAWVEIYVDGIGWMPKDMTPGVIGSFEEVGPGGDKIETQFDDNNNKNDNDGTDEDEPAEEKAESGSTNKLLIKLGDYSVEQIIKFLAVVIVVGIILSVIAAVFIRYYNDYGYNFLTHRTALDRSLYIFAAIYARVRKLGLDKGLDSQSEEFEALVEREIEARGAEKKGEFARELDLLYKACYSDVNLSEENVINLRNTLKILRRRRK